MVAVLVASAAEAAAIFTPNDPLAPRQWYLAADHAFDYFPVGLPQLPPVRVAVIDSGLDCNHPEFQGRVAAVRSFVGGSACVDQSGHGTFVAGEIAAATNNGVGIAGIAFPAQLLIAKIAGSGTAVSVEAESKAIRWAADQGARVINLSIGGLRDPADPGSDSFSQQEADAVAYAFGKGAVIVASVGNGTESPHEPWPYASYPAALPHVLGVSAYDPGGSIPSFSNRDRRYNDLAAPGTQILSTLPTALTAADPSCTDQGYSDCGPGVSRDGAGTSFAAPQVSAAAALLIAEKPDLRPEQVITILERTADDMTPANGCSQCLVGRDPASGWGRLDIAQALRALTGPLPPSDRYEPNDDAGARAFPLAGSKRKIFATLDYWDDPIDVYRVALRRGQTLTALVEGPPSGAITMALWKPGTVHVTAGPAATRHSRLLLTERPGGMQRFTYRVLRSGDYYLELQLRTPGSGQYELDLTKVPARTSSVPRP